MIYAHNGLNLIFGSVFVLKSLKSLTHRRILSMTCCCSKMIPNKIGIVKSAERFLDGSEPARTSKQGTEPAEIDFDSSESLRG